MRPRIILFWFLAVMAAVVAAALTAGDAKAPAPRSAVVLVADAAGGHGSGFHVGNGYIITAAHVVGTDTKFSIETESGDKTEAELMWVSKTYDLAMIRAKGSLDAGVAKLACREPVVNENIVAAGNPVSIKFIRTFGQVAGGVRKVDDNRALFVMSIPIIPGMSGGPVFDEKGFVIGIVDAVMVAPIGMSGSMAAVGFAVPSTALCGLIGRA